MQNFILIIIVLIVAAFAFKSYQKQKAKTAKEESESDLILAVLGITSQREATRRAEIEGKASAKDWMNLGTSILNTVSSFGLGGRKKT